MNRKKKIFDIFNTKVKKAKARMNPGNKPKYISKAKRAEMALEEQNKAEEAVSENPSGE
ncbi:MAG: DUF2986 domain-containing protein [Bermanella sp.]